MILNGPKLQEFQFQWHKVKSHRKPDISPNCQVKKQLPHADVAVLEAQPRLGGRIWSASWRDGTKIDLGAHFLHGVTCDEHPLAQIAKDG